MKIFLFIVFSALGFAATDENPNETVPTLRKTDRVTNLFREGISEKKFFNEINEMFVNCNPTAPSFNELERFVEGFPSYYHAKFIDNKNITGKHIGLLEGIIEESPYIINTLLQGDFKELNDEEYAAIKAKAAELKQELITRFTELKNQSQEIFMERRRREREEAKRLREEADKAYSVNIRSVFFSKSEIIDIDQVRTGLRELIALGVFGKYRLTDKIEEFIKQIGNYIANFDRTSNFIENAEFIRVLSDIKSSLEQSYPSDADSFDFKEKELLVIKTIEIIDEYIIIFKNRDIIDSNVFDNKDPNEVLLQLRLLNLSGIGNVYICAVTEPFIDRLTKYAENHDYVLGTEFNEFLKSLSSKIRRCPRAEYLSHKLEKISEEITARMTHDYENIFTISSEQFVVELEKTLNTNCIKQLKTEDLKSFIERLKQKISQVIFLESDIPRLAKLLMLIHQQIHDRFHAVQRAQPRLVFNYSFDFSKAASTEVAKPVSGELDRLKEIWIHYESFYIKFIASKRANIDIDDCKSIMDNLVIFDQQGLDIQLLDNFNTMLAWWFDLGSGLPKSAEQTDILKRRLLHIQGIESKIGLVFSKIEGLKTLLDSASCTLLAHSVAGIMSAKYLVRDSALNEGAKLLKQLRFASEEDRNQCLSIFKQALEQIFETELFLEFNTVFSKRIWPGHTNHDRYRYSHESAQEFNKESKSIENIFDRAINPVPVSDGALPQDTNQLTYTIKAPATGAASAILISIYAGHYKHDKTNMPPRDLPDNSIIRIGLNLPDTLSDISQSAQLRSENFSDTHARYLKMVSNFVAYIKQQHPGLPVFLNGVSFGGFFVSSYAMLQSVEIDPTVYQPFVLNAFNENFNGQRIEPVNGVISEQGAVDYIDKMVQDSSAAWSKLSVPTLLHFNFDDHRVGFEGTRNLMLAQQNKYNPFMVLSLNKRAARDFGADVMQKSSMFEVGELVGLRGSTRGHGSSDDEALSHKIVDFMENASKNTGSPLHIARQKRLFEIYQPYADREIDQFQRDKQQFLSNLRNTQQELSDQFVPAKKTRTQDGTQLIDRHMENITPPPGIALSDYHESINGVSFDKTPVASRNFNDVKK